MWTKVIIDTFDYSETNDKPHIVFIETNHAVAKDFCEQFNYVNVYVSSVGENETPAIENVDEYSCYDNGGRINVHVYNTDRLVNMGYLKASENQSIWTMFRIKPEYYKHQYQHYCTYYECDTDEALKIFRKHSRVFDHYEFVGNIAPDILNVKNYRDSNGDFHQVYHKEDFKKLLE